MTFGPTFDDGRGKFPARIGMSAPRGMRDAIREAAQALGTTSAAFMRDAIDARLQAHMKALGTSQISGDTPHGA